MNTRSDHPDTPRDELQQRIDASLRRQYAPPAAPDLAFRPTWRRTLRPLAVAASLVLAAAGLWQIQLALRGPAAGGYGPWRSVSEVYHDTVAGKLDYWACDDDEEFQKTFELHHRQRLAMGELPQGVQALGLGYCTSLSRRSVCMLGRAEGRDVVVLVDRVVHDSEPELPEDSTLHLFRRQLGPLVLYEISPLTEPALIPHFYLPEAPS